MSEREALGDLQQIPADFQYPKVIDWLVRVATEGVCNPTLNPGSAPIEPPFDRPAPYLSSSGNWAKAIKKTCGGGPIHLATFLVSPKSTQAKRNAKLDVVMCVATDGAAPRWPLALIDVGWGVEHPYVCERAVLTPNHCDGGQCTAPTWEYEFLDEWLVSTFWQRAGFREPN